MPETPFPMNELRLPEILLALVVLGLFVATVANAYRAATVRRKISELSKRYLATYFEKVDKIPVVVESIRSHAREDAIYEDVLALHRAAIISNSTSAYDVLENDARISREFRFLMKLSVRIPEIARDGNFIYARSLWIFHESNARRLLAELDDAIRAYESIRKSRGKTVFGLLIPMKRMFPLGTS